MSSWQCDGIPKNGKTYDGLGGEHNPVENYGPDCEDCGLPKEAMLAGKGKQKNSGGGSGGKTPVAAIAVSAVALILAGGGGYWWTQIRCPAGFERIATECLDPYQDTYQAALTQAQSAIDSALAAQDVTELEAAQAALTEAIATLDTIPETAAIFPEASLQASTLRDERGYLEALIQSDPATQEARTQIAEAQDRSTLQAAATQLSQVLEGLKSIPQTAGVFPKVEEHINALNPEVQAVQDRLAEAETAQNQLAAIETRAATVKDNGTQASSIAALESVQREWTTILQDLDQIPESPLVTAQIDAKREEYNQALAQVRGRLADLVAASRPAPPVRQPQRQTPVPPATTTPPVSNPSGDSCAVEPKPPSCLF